MNKQTIIVAGIGTDTGKTVVSAILCKALNAEYWKPVQAGDLQDSDSHKIERWVPETTIHQEAYRLSKPMSPHAASAIDDIIIEPAGLAIPTSTNSLIIELAGGLMVPMREDFLNIDWLAGLGMPVILVSNYYLGSINHTLLSLAALKARQIPVLGIVFNGDKNQSTFDVIMHRSNLKCLLEIDLEDSINSAIIEHYASKINL